MKIDLNNERGAVYPLALFLIPVFLLMGGLIIDIGMGVYQHTKLTSAVDAAAIATLDAYDREAWEVSESIIIDEAEALGLARTFLIRNMSEATLQSVEVNGTRVVVKAKAISPVFFMSMFGKGDLNLKASARASLNDDS